MQFGNPMVGRLHPIRSMLGGTLTVRRNPLLALVLIVTLLAAPAGATELQPTTVAAFDHYIAVTETRMAVDLRNRQFFVIDRLPDAERSRAYEALRRGELHIEQLHTTDDGRPVPMPGGLIHHWVGMGFIPGATLLGTLAVLQDADHYQDIFKPAVRHSKLVSLTDDQLEVSEQFYRKTIVTVAANADFKAQYHFVTPSRLVCESRSTRIAEVEHPGEAAERELPVGNDHGYLWRLNSYWHLEERDGGVYVQMEFVSLSRTVPAMFLWAVQPFLKSVPRGVLETLLTTSRAAVIARSGNRAGVETSTAAHSTE